MKTKRDNRHLTPYQINRIFGFKVKKGSKAAKRRKSYCARSAGQMKKFPKAAKNPNSRLRQARKRWKC